MASLLGESRIGGGHYRRLAVASDDPERLIEHVLRIPRPCTRQAAMPSTSVSVCSQRSISGHWFDEATQPG